MVDKLARYSYSALDCYNSCPQKFKFEYVDKIKKESRQNAPALMGNIVHTALDNLYKLGADGIVMPVDDLKSFYKNEWESVGVENILVDSDFHTIDDYIRIGEEILIKYYEKHKPFNQSILLGTEQNLYFTLPGTDFPCKCRVDRMSKRDDGTIEIVDYKTGVRLAKVSDSSYYYQMGLYQLAVMENYPDFKNIEVVQYFLRHEEAVTRKFSEEELDSLVVEFKDAILETIHAQQTGSFQPQESGLCRFCEYYDICPAKIHGKLLEQEDEATGEIPALSLKELADTYIDKNSQMKVLKDELDALKEELKTAAKQYNISVFEGEDGKVSVAISNEYKFVTKTADFKKFADLSFLCREAGLEEFFSLDVNALMKEGFLKERFPEELAEKLKEYIEKREASRVTVRKTKQKKSPQ